MRRATQAVRLRVLFLALFFALGAVAVAPLAEPAPRAAADGCAEPGGADPYLHTCGAQIVAADGTPVVLHALNWYGFDSNDFVAGGLRYATYQAIVDRIKALGYNALRIPFSNELVERDPVVSDIGPICVGLSCLPITGAQVLGLNGELAGRDALSILKTIVDYAGQQGLYVILDDHRSEAAWGPEENGLWYTNTLCPSDAAPYTCYTPQSWLNDWNTVGRLFQNDPYVIGMDLRNEPHWVNPAVSGGAGRWQPSSCALYVQFAHWGPCGGVNNDSTDWAQAATQAGNELLGLNPHWLIFVEGGSTYPQDAGDTTFSQDGWGENLQGVASDPIRLSVANRLVYSPHDYRNYGPTDSAADMTASWTRNFGFLAEPGQPYTAPLWLGEFGTCTHDNSCVSDVSSGNQAGWWFSTLIGYLDNPPNGIAGPISWGYWPVNGTYSDSWSYDGSPSSQHWRTCYGQREDYGVLGGDWSTLSSPLLQSLLLPATATPSPSATPSSTATATPSATATDTPSASATVMPSASATVMPSASATVSATATITGAATATPTETPSPTATATPTSSPTASDTATPMPTATPGPPTQWPTFSCAPYTLVPTPAPTATATPTPVSQPQPRAANTATPTATPTPTLTPSPTATATATLPPTAIPTPRATSTPTPRPKSNPRPTPRPAPPLVAARGTDPRRIIWLDVQVRRASHRLSGWLRYNDHRKGLALHDLVLRAADATCGSTRTATVVARLGDKRHTYDATLRLTIDRKRHARFTMRLGRGYVVTAALSGSASITCAPRPPTAPARPAGPPFPWEHRLPPSRSY